MFKSNSFTNSSVISKDGTNIGYISIGHGPGLIVIHGALSTSDDFRKFAEELSDFFTVHVVDRRGRGMSGPQGTPYTISKECEDIKALQEATGANYVFGHSYGGLVAIETAYSFHSFSKMALYEPGVSIHALQSDWDWMIEYEDAMNHNDSRRAFASFVQGAGHTPLTRMPKWYAKFILRMMVRGNQWNKIEKLLHENLNEHKEVMRLDSTFENYKQIDADILLMSGENSPESVHEMIQVLDDNISKVQTIVLPKLDHLSPQNENTSVEVAKRVKEYFLI